MVRRATHAPPLALGAVQGLHHQAIDSGLVRGVLAHQRGADDAVHIVHGLQDACGSSRCSSAQGVNRAVVYGKRAGSGNSPRTRVIA
jgi:hypothetical protein